MKLTQLIETLEYRVVKGDDDIEVSTLVYDSRKVEKDSVFVCIPGTNVDGHDFADDVIAKGAAAIIVERELPVDGAAQILVDDARYALAVMSAAYFDHPAEKIRTIGITGTKGKTTTTYPNT